MQSTCFEYKGCATLKGRVVETREDCMPPGSHTRDRLLHPPQVSFIIIKTNDGLNDATSFYLSLSLIFLQKTQTMEMGTFGILILSGD